MPVTLKEWLEKTNGGLNQQQLDVFDKINIPIFYAATNAISDQNYDMNNTLMGLMGGMMKIKYPTVASGDEEEKEKNFASGIKTFTDFAESLKDKETMMKFAKASKADTNAPTFGGDCQLMTDTFQLLNDVYGSEIDIDAFKKGYNDCKKELIEGIGKNEEKKPEPKPVKEKKTQQQKRDEIVLYGMEDVEDYELEKEVIEENKEEEELEKDKKKLEEIILNDANNISNININDNADDVIEAENDASKNKDAVNINAEQNNIEANRNRANINFQQAKQLAKDFGEDLYAQHNDTRWWMISFGGASDELKKVRNAYRTYNLYMGNPTDEKFKNKSEFDILKTIASNSDKYRALKKEHGVGDTSKPDWEPKTQMGKTRYRAAGNMSDFAKNRMKELVTEYMKEKNITLEEAYKHFDPKNEIKLYDFDKIKAKEAKKKEAENKIVDFNEVISNSQQNLKKAYKDTGLGEEFPGKDTNYDDYLNITTVYYIKTKIKGSTSINAKKFEDAKKYVSSLKEFDQMMKASSEDLYNKSTRDKGQDMLGFFNNTRENIKEQEKIKQEHSAKNDLNPTNEINKTTPVVQGNSTVIK